MNDRNKLMKKIYQYDFALYETILYLDTHPTNKKALNYYSKVRDEVAKLKNEYNTKYGPITASDNNDPNDWHWIDKPWPWEKEANL